MTRSARWPVLLALAAGRVVLAGNASIPGRLIEEPPTLKCLGVRWLVGGDANRNARIEVRYRKAGEEAWRPALDLFRVETAGIREAARPPAGQTLFAGSVFGLDEATAYEVRLRLNDPDGGDAERVVRMTTWKEPLLPKEGRAIPVRPGELSQALANTKPGDILRLHAGVYRGTFRPRSGTPEKPIVLTAAGDGEAILDGEGKSNVISAPNLRDVFFEGLSFRNARWAIAVNGGARIVVRRCTITGCEYGFVAQQRAEQQSRIVIADNVMVGPSTWPRTKGIENARGVQIAGTGHVVCCNRIRGFADAIDTFSTYPCSAIDIYGNEISECTDDGIELDYSEHNVRCFGNRLTNVFQGISVQPLHGGPAYIFRNALYNVTSETFKMHNAPSGALCFHNTSVKAGMPLVLYSGAAVRNCILRNNLFVGTAGNYAYETTAPMRECDFDYDGFGGQWKQFLKWNGRRYRSLADAQAAGLYRHAVRVDPAALFQSGLLPPADATRQFTPKANDLRLKAGSKALDAGAPLPNVNDGFQGKAPDLGACEFGQELPHYGPRPVAKDR